MKVNRTIHALLVLVALFNVVGCASLDVDRIMSDLYEREPDARQEVENAVGYITFTGFSLHPGLATFGTMKGEAVHNASGERTPMKFFRLGVGPGLAIKGYYLIAVVKDEELYSDIIDGKWQAGALAEATFKFGDFGGGVGTETSFSKKVDAYRWSHTGFALEVAIGGGRMWPN